MAKNLQVVYKHCVCHLDTVHHLIPSNIHFEFNGFSRHICSCSLPVPLNFEFSEMPVTDAPIIFQLTGNISDSDPIITSDQPKETSFWVECRPDTISRALWSRIPRSLESIARASKLALNFSDLYKFDEETGSLKLRIAWTSMQTTEVSNCESDVQNSNQVTKMVWSKPDRQVPTSQKPHYLCSFMGILVLWIQFSMARLCRWFLV